MVFVDPLIKEIPNDWIVIDEKQSTLKDIEIQCVYLDCGVISLTQIKKNIYYN